MARLKPDTGIDDKTIPTFLFSFIVSLLAEQGIPARETLLGTRLTAEDLASADTRISYRQGLKLIENAMALSPDQALGLTVAARQTLSSWGLLGYALSSCKSGLDAMRIGSRYYPLATSLSDFSFIEDDAEVIVRLDTPFPAGHLLPFIVEESFGSQITIGRSSLTRLPTRWCLTWRASRFLFPHTIRRLNNWR